MILSTLCYIEKDNKYLMLHRTKKKNDINKDKWLGIGGKFIEEKSKIGETMKVLSLTKPYATLIIDML